MWNVSPRIMCTKHLLGEHVEMHMFVGCIQKGISLDGYIRNNLVAPMEIERRHNELSEEMTRRGMKHSSPLKTPDITYLGEKQFHKVDSTSSLLVLLSRCKRCNSGGTMKKIKGTEMSNMLMMISTVQLILWSIQCNGLEKTIEDLHGLKLKYRFGWDTITQEVYTGFLRTLALVLTSVKEGK